jgi:hypothetical protein
MAADNFKTFLLSEVKMKLVAISIKQVHHSLVQYKAPALDSPYSINIA